MMAIERIRDRTDYRKDDYRGVRADRKAPTSRWTDHARWLHYLACVYGGRLDDHDEPPISFHQWIAMGKPGGDPPPYRKGRKIGRPRKRAQSKSDERG